MLTKETIVKIRKLYPVQRLSRVTIQKLEVVEEATLKPNGELHNRENIIALQAMNEGIDLLDGIDAGDKVKITCYINGKETATIDGIRRWTDLRLASLKKLDIHV